MVAFGRCMDGEQWADNTGDESDTLMGLDPHNLHGDMAIS